MAVSACEWTYKVLCSHLTDTSPSRMQALSEMRCAECTPANNNVFARASECVCNRM